MEKKPSWTGPKKPAAQRPAEVAKKKGDKENKDQHAINDRIRAKEVRLVGDNVEQGVYPIAEALRIADELDLDLIEISPNAEPPVCRVLDYQKFLYQQRKRLDLCFSNTFNAKRMSLFKGEVMGAKDCRLHGKVVHDNQQSGVHLIKFTNPTAGTGRIIPLSEQDDEKIRNKKTLSE